MAPGEVVPLDFNYALVILSYTIAVFGSYVALTAAARIRGDASGSIHVVYVGVAAVALGGVGIWSMHFIAMQAQMFPFGLHFDYVKTALSLCIAIGLSGWALWYVARDRFTIFRCLFGGLLAGSGAVLMHYMGVFAMGMPAIIIWDVPVVALSVVVAITAAAAALWLAFNVVSTLQRVFAALVMGAAITGMHYIGTVAATVVCTTSDAGVADGIAGKSLPYITFLLSAVVLLAMYWQLRRTSIQYRAELAARVDALIAPVDTQAT